MLKVKRETLKRLIHSFSHPGRESYAQSFFMMKIRDKKGFGIIPTDTPGVPGRVRRNNIIVLNFPFVRYIISKPQTPIA